MANLLDRQNIAKASPPSGITGGTTTVTGITNGYILYNNAGVVGGLDPTTLSADITIGTSDVVGGTQGSVLFIGASTKVQQDNANFFWDDTNNQLQLNATGSSAGLLLGGDALLYRSAADVLRTPDSLLVDSRVGIGDTVSSTRRLYIYNPTASDVGLYIASDGASTISANIVNSGGGSNNALILNSFNGATNYALNIANGDIAFGTGTGTKIGADANMKLAFWSKTPIVQPTTGITGAALVSNGGTTITSTDTFGGYTLQQLAAVIINTGLAQ